jgi:DNA repair and recombination protein RAD52
MAAPPNRQQNGAFVANNTASIPPQPQTPNAGFTRSISNSAQIPRPQPQPGVPPQPQPVLRRLNQPSRNINSAPQSPIRPIPTPDDTEISLPPQGAGFFSARGVKETIGLEGNAKPNETISNAAPVPLPTHITPFNPHAESPSIRKTPGVDHKSSKPLARDGKHVPSTQTAAAGTTTTTAASGPILRGNVVNPALDGARRIGAPNSPSPMANRNSYKPPSKRPVDSRAPLVDLPANGTVGLADQGGDLKRQRLND